MHTRSPGDEMHVNYTLTERGTVAGYLKKHDKFESQVTQSSSVYVYRASAICEHSCTDYDIRRGKPRMLSEPGFKKK
jgi:hypothetical protein